MTSGKKRRDAIMAWASPLLLLLAFLYIFIDSFFLKGIVADYVGPGFVPRIASGIGILCVLRVLISQIKAAKNGDAISVESEEDELAGTSQTSETPADSQPPRGKLSAVIEQYGVLISIGLIMVYIAAMQILGFTLSTAVYLFVQMLVAAPQSKRKPLLFAILAVVFAVGINLIFYRAFSILLPQGTLF